MHLRFACVTFLIFYFLLMRKGNRDICVAATGAERAIQHDDCGYHRPDGGAAEGAPAHGRRERRVRAGVINVSQTLGVSMWVLFWPKDGSRFREVGFMWFENAHEPFHLFC